MIYKEVPELLTFLPRELWLIIQKKVFEITRKQIEEKLKFPEEKYERCYFEIEKLSWLIVDRTVRITHHCWDFNYTTHYETDVIYFTKKHNKYMWL